MKLVLQIAAGVLLAWAVEWAIEAIAGYMALRDTTAAVEQAVKPRPVAWPPAVIRGAAPSAPTAPAADSAPVSRSCAITKADGTTVRCSDLKDGIARSPGR